MSHDEPKTVRVKPLRDFNDAGTESRFTKNKEVDLPEGVAANYQAAGLIEIVAVETANAGDPAKTSRSRA